MNRWLSFALAALAALVTPLSASAQLTAVPLGSSSAPYGYYEYLPFGYDDATSEEWPVVIFLHGIGERGNGTTELFKVLAQGVPKNISDGTQYPFIAISPQSPSSAGSWSVSNLDTLVQFVKSNYHVNEDRIYLTGLSMGAMGTWNYARTNPEELAAIWPVCGAQTTIEGLKLVNIPTWAFHSWGDSTTSADYSVQWTQSIATALAGGPINPLLANYPGTYTGPPGPGKTSDKDRTVSFTASTETWTWLDNVAQVAGSHPTLTLYKGTSHNCWSDAYNNPTAWKWLLAQNRYGAANKAPTANITAPANGATFNDPPSITITAQVADSDGTIARVEFYAGSQLLGTDNSSPHQFVWSNPPAGTHWLTVKAIDNDNAVGAALVKINVDDPDALFQQDFQSCTSISCYVHATAPNNGQFNDISAESEGGTWSIQGGRLQLVRPGSGTTVNDAGITRFTDLDNPAPSLLHVTFDVGVSNWTLSPWQTGAIWMNVANISGFTEYGGSEPAVNVFSGLSVNGKGGGKYTINAAGVDSAQLNADGTMYRVALFLNKSGAAVSYRAPDNTVRTLRSNGVALWVDSSPVVVDAAATNGSSSALTDFRLRWSNSDAATYMFDNWLIRGSFPQ